MRPMSETGKSTTLKEALVFFDFLRGAGVKGEIAGSVWKRVHRGVKSRAEPAEIHDIDIVVRECDWEQTWKVVTCISGVPSVPVEFYIAAEGSFDRLLAALRASRYEVINGRLMAGCRFKKVQWDDILTD